MESDFTAAKWPFSYWAAQVAQTGTQWLVNWNLYNPTDKLLITWSGCGVYVDSHIDAKSSHYGERGLQEQNSPNAAKEKITV